MRYVALSEESILRYSRGGESAGPAGSSPMLPLDDDTAEGGDPTTFAPVADEGQAPARVSVPFAPAAEVEALDAEDGWNPSEDQAVAMQRLLAALELPGVYQLRGAAGSGKTTLIRALLRRLAPGGWTVALLAPTWAAANRLTTVIGPAVLKRVDVIRATSLHKYIYGKPVEQRLCSACNAWSASLFKPVVEEVVEYVDADAGIESNGTESNGTESDGSTDTHGSTESDGSTESNGTESDGSTESDSMLPVAVETGLAPKARVALKVKRAVYTCEYCKQAFKSTSAFPERLTFELASPSALLPRLVVVDESSMISRETLADIEDAVMDGKTRVLLVGDPNQIPPVSTSDNPQSPVDFSAPTAALDRVHRQAEGNPVLALAHANKSYPAPDKLPDWPFPRVWRGDRRVAAPFGGVPEIARWHAERRSRGDLVVTVALSNAMRARINCAVRELLTLSASSRSLRQPFVPGDRILLRSNCLPSGVYNGEMHVVTGVWSLSPGMALLDERLRCSLRPRGPAADAKQSERNELLGGVEIGVWQVQTWPLFAPPDERRNGYVVAPIVNGRPWLESDFIVGDTDTAARSRARAFTRAWVDEYSAALSALKAEREKLQHRMDVVHRWIARLRTSPKPAPNVVIHAIRELAAVFPSAQQEEVRQGAMAAYEEERYDDIEAMFWSPKMTACATAATVEDYAVLRHGALRPGYVWNVDYGECVTGHAMQGSQADHIAVVCDRAFWGLWLKDRLAGMKWMYTAMTRTTEHLALFRVPKDAA